MALFNRQKSSDIPVELQPYYDAPKAPTRSWVRWIVRVAIVLVVLLFLFVFVRWVWHETHSATKTPAGSATTTQQVAPHTAASGTDGQSSSSATSSDSSSSSQASAAASSTSAPSTDSSGTGLVDTGPGNTAAMFAIVTIAGAMLYQLRLRQKANS